jgi:hypothetical protein
MSPEKHDLPLFVGMKPAFMLLPFWLNLELYPHSFNYCRRTILCKILLKEQRFGGENVPYGGFSGEKSPILSASQSGILHYFEEK